jgi:hypothetical protein
MNRSFACSGIQLVFHLTHRSQMVGARGLRVLRERDKVSWYSRGLTRVSQPKVSRKTYARGLWLKIEQGTMKERSRRSPPKAL